MSDNVNNPSHYVKNAIVIEPIELTGRLNSCLGQVIQYVIRRKDKDTELENLQKAKYYLNWYEKNIMSIAFTNKLNVGSDGVGHVELLSLISIFTKHTKDKFSQNFMFSLFDGEFVSKDSVRHAITLLEEEIKKIGRKVNDEI